VHKSFNFKMFTDVLSAYRNENITKTPHYKICEFLKKRGISLTNEFTKWMERNKKNKEISEAIKLKTYIFPRELYVGFVKELGSELTEKEAKEMMASFHNPIEFSLFNQKLEQIYRKGNSNIETEEVTAYLQQVYRKILKTNVSVERLFQDFATEDKFKMRIDDFAEMVKFLQVGLSKIQNKLIFSLIDLEKKGFITLNELQNAIEDASEDMEKEEDEYELDFIIEKLVIKRDKYTLKNSRIPFTLERAVATFVSILTTQEVAMIYKKAQE
jgi:Ca2+-binding EF-hand superfamily protein